MEKVIKDYYEVGSYQGSSREAYEFWKYNRSKFATWLKYKRQATQGVDVWDKIILASMNPGNTVVYDSQALYWKRLVSNVRIVENAVPNLVKPFVEQMTPELDSELQGTVNNLILFRPLSCKLTESLTDYLTKPMFTRSGNTPKLVDWLAKDAKIYISLGQEFFSFNRFKFTLLDFIEHEAERFDREYGFRKTLLKVSKNDSINGSIKLIFERR